jgi:hypothetical protein
MYTCRKVSAEADPRVLAAAADPFGTQNVEGAQKAPIVGLEGGVTRVSSDESWLQLHVPGAEIPPVGMRYWVRAAETESCSPDVVVVTTEEAQQAVTGCQWAVTSVEVPEGTLQACLEFQDLLPQVVAIAAVDMAALAWLPPGPEDAFAIVGTIVNGHTIVRVLVLGVQLAPFALLVADMLAAPAVVLTDVVWDGSVWMSMGHSDSWNIAQMLRGLAVGGTLSEVGDGRSSGSVTIYVGGQAGKAYFVILYVAGRDVKFAVLETSIIRGSGKSGLRALPTEFGLNAYYDPSTLLWVCGWTMSNKIGKDVPAEFYLSVGDAWVAWDLIKVRYQPLVRIAEVPIP